MAWDMGADDDLDFELRYTYDEAGHTLTEEWDYEGDGVIDSRTTFTYDLDGTAATRTEDSDGDGAIDRTSTYVYDRDGVLIAEDFEVPIDDGAPIPGRLTYLYDRAGRLVRTEEDFGLDGVLDEVTDLTYEDGLLVLYESDYDNDGTADYRVSYAYDDDGNLLHHETDRDADGVAERISDYTYDELGRTVTVELSGTSFDPPVRTTYLYECASAARAGLVRSAPSRYTPPHETRHGTHMASAPPRLPRMQDAARRRDAVRLADARGDRSAEHRRARAARRPAVDAARGRSRGQPVEHRREAP
jgi:hypothetical protein